MSSHTLKKIQKDGYEVQVESAVRDGTGAVIATALASKQPMLTAGTNITIVGNTISATGGTEVIWRTH